MKSILVFAFTIILMGLNSGVSAEEKTESKENKPKKVIQNDSIFKFGLGGGVFKQREKDSETREYSSFNYFNLSFGGELYENLNLYIKANLQEMFRDRKVNGETKSMRGGASFFGLEGEYFVIEDLGLSLALGLGYISFVEKAKDTPLYGFGVSAGANYKVFSVDKHDFLVYVSSENFFVEESQANGFTGGLSWRFK